jgi:hypothetical protein
MKLHALLCFDVTRNRPVGIAFAQTEEEAQALKDGITNLESISEQLRPQIRIYLENHNPSWPWQVYHYFEADIPAHVLVAAQILEGK